MIQQLLLRMRFQGLLAFTPQADQHSSSPRLTGQLYPVTAATEISPVIRRHSNFWVFKSKPHQREA